MTSVVSRGGRCYHDILWYNYDTDRSNKLLITFLDNSMAVNALTSMYTLKIWLISVDWKHLLIF